MLAISAEKKNINTVLVFLVVKKKNISIRRLVISNAIKRNMCMEMLVIVVVLKISMYMYPTVL